MRVAVRVRAYFPLASLLVLQAALAISSSWRNSPCYDEVGHFAAGLHHWETGTFDLYRVNPPLSRLVATLPLRLAGVRTPGPVTDTAPPSRPEFALGSKFIAVRGPEAMEAFRVARAAQCPLLFVGTVAIYYWARELHGVAVAWLTTLAWVLCPMAIANAQYISPDATAASFGVAAGYGYWRWLRGPTPGRATAAGLLYGLALSCKSTLLILLPFWLLLAGPRLVMGRSGGSPHGRLAVVGQLVLLTSSALVVVNAVYAFEGTGAPLGGLLLTSDAMTVPDGAGGRVNRFTGTPAGDLPLPVPRNLVQGVDVQKRDFERGFPSYLRGEWRQGGWWYYYLYALLIKTPVPLQLVLLLACARAVVRPTGAAAFLAAHALYIVAFVSLFTGFNHHARYVLTALPFACLFASFGFALLWQWSRPATLLVAGWIVAASASVYPHYIPYYNSYVGGSENGYLHLIDSNTDWGQDLLRLKDWLDRHPETGRVGLAYFGHFDPAAFGIDYRLPPRLPDPDRPADPAAGPQPGWYAISVTLRQGQAWGVRDGTGGSVNVKRDDFAYFRELTPVHCIGHSIHIYHLWREECDALRAKFNLPPLGAREPGGRVGRGRSRPPHSSQRRANNRCCCPGDRRS
jgi:Dolichyl-phosphate-mannose-protein mannosyltransferase